MSQWSKLSFRRRLLLVMTLSGLIELMILSGAGFSYIKYWEAKDSGEKALGIAKFLADSPTILQAVEANQPDLMTHKIERLRSSIGAAFIVVGDKNGIRLAHPIPERLGLPMRGGDNDKALQMGLSYVSFAEGSLGKSVRGKTPIFNAKGEIIGVVSVGYLLTSIHDKVEPFLLFLIGMALLVVLANAILSNYAAHRFQRAILGFEPEEIGRLYVELDVTLSTLREGVLSIDAEGNLRSINRSACEILGIDEKMALRKPLSHVLPDSDLTKLLITHQSEHDTELLLNGQVVVANREPLLVNGMIVGAVSSFRLKDEISELTKQLSQVREYADLLRSQTHEHRNKLNTISGLVQLGKTQDVQRLIGQETEHYQNLIQFLREAVNDPVIAGVILGKSERARELGLSLEIDDGTRLEILPSHVRSEDMVTIIGNLIDNAFEASLASDELLTLEKKSIQISLTDYGQELIIEVDDQGCGLPRNVHPDTLTQRGVSSKSASNRGVGLYLVNQLVHRYQGQLVMENKTTQGTRMTVYIPKEIQHA